MNSQPEPGPGTNAKTFQIGIASGNKIDYTKNDHNLGYPESAGRGCTVSPAESALRKQRCVRFGTMEAVRHVDRQTSPLSAGTYNP